MKYFSEDKFRKVENKHCNTEAYDRRYNSVEEAKKACAGDPKCRGVYDFACDGLNSRGFAIALCPVDSRIGGFESSGAGSCIYEKTG